MGNINVKTNSKFKKNLKYLKYNNRSQIHLYCYTSQILGMNIS